jgi:hypothetical protein
MGLIGYSGTPAGGAQQQLFNGVPITTPATSDAAGTIAQGEAYFNGPAIGTPGFTQQSRMGIYADSSGAPGALLASSNEVLLNQGMASAWVPYTFPSPPTVSNGQLLWLAVHGGLQDQQVAIGYTGAGPSVYTTFAYASGLPNPFGTATAASLLYGIRATVTPSGGGGGTANKKDAPGVGSSGLWIPNMKETRIEALDD